MTHDSSALTLPTAATTAPEQTPSVFLASTFAPSWKSLGVSFETQVRY